MLVYEMEQGVPSRPDCQKSNKKAMNHDTDVVEMPLVNESPSTGGVDEKEISREVLRSSLSTLPVMQSWVND